MLMSTFVLFHICNAVVGLSAGALSMLFRKGSGLHRVAGTIFSIGMLGMASSGVFIATFLKPNRGNVMAGSLMIYLVATGWEAARRKERRVSAFDFGALAAALAVGGAALTWGIQAAGLEGGVKDGYPAGLFFFFGTIILLFAVADVRMIVRGGVAGAQRLARHLWRMCLALLLATVSLYPGQAKLFSAAMRRNSALYLPHILLIGATIFWMVRVLRRKRVRSDQPAFSPHDAEAVIRKVA